MKLKVIIIINIFGINHIWNDNEKKLNTKNVVEKRANDMTAIKKQKHNRDFI